MVFTIVLPNYCTIYPLVYIPSVSMLALHSQVSVYRFDRYRWSVLLVAILIGSLCFFPLDLYAETASPSLSQGSGETLEQQYKTAKDYILRLQQDGKIGKDRGNWLNGVRNFRKIHLAQKEGPLGPSSLYMMALTYRQMYDQFKVPIDLENAIEQFTETATLYPSHSLADDALFKAAESSLLEKGKERQAMELYRKIVDVYPKSDHYNKALARIQPQREKRQDSAGEEPALSSPAKNLVQILPVKYWSSAGYTRLVIQTSSPVSFTSGLFEKESGQPRRLWVDLAQSYLPPQFRQPIPIKDGLLKEAGASQFNSDTVRFTFAIESLSDYKVFSLGDPFRVIVDIQGEKAPILKESQEKTSPTITSLPVEQQRITPVIAPQDGVGQPIISLEDQKKRSPLTELSKKPISRDAISLAQQLGLGIRKIVIDPGHGGKDPGAMAFGLKEKDIVLKVSQKIAKILRSNYRYEVILTRTKDVYLPLEERTAIANAQHSDLFISIHVNAHPNKANGGIETYFLNLATNADAMRVAALENATSTHNIGELQEILTNLMKNSKIDESSRLAQFVQTNLVSGLEQKYNLHDLGVKQAPFYVLIGARMPAILAEISFITNPEEAKYLRDEHYLSKIAEQIAAGIATYVDHHQTAAIKF